MKGILKITRLAFCVTLALAFFSCSSGGDDSSALLALAAVSNGGTTQTTSDGNSTTTTTPGTTSVPEPIQTPTPTPTQEPTPNPEQPPTPTPTPALADTYTITFNANDRNENSDADTQTFAAGTPQALKKISELGFSKDGFYFAGWGMSPDANCALYADGWEYTASADITFYAVWSDVPVYTVNRWGYPGGSFTVTHVTAPVGTEITLSNTPNEGYKFNKYYVHDENGNPVSVTEGKFTMPESDVRVIVEFIAIDYNIYIETVANGTVMATSATATLGTEVALSNKPAAGYTLSSYTVTDADGAIVDVVDGKFIMPAKNVTVTATFNATINYNINVGTFSNGSVDASTATATVGTRVTLTAKPEANSRFVTLTVTDSEGTTVSVSGTGNSRAFDMPARNVTVTALFALDIYLTFGSWPQTIKSAWVSIDQDVTKTVGIFTYCKGSDGEWYAKIKEKALTINGVGPKYSDGTSVKKSSDDSYKWFKEEPIKWRVLTKNYNGTGNRLLLAENILIAKRYDASFNNYQNSEIRKWLNSNANSADVSDHSDSGGFLNTAFSAVELAAILDTSVNNSERTTFPDEYDSSISTDYDWNYGNNQFASDTPTIDKIFLLSVQEATKSEYGFDVYNSYGEGNTRIHLASDYAKASGAMHGTEWVGGMWWLRSPCGYGSTTENVREVSGYGHSNSQEIPSKSYLGVVPALCIGN